MNDSKDFQDAESVRSGNSHVTSQPRLFPKHPVLEGCGMQAKKFVFLQACEVIGQTRKVLQLWSTRSSSK